MVSVLFCIVTHYRLVTLYTLPYPAMHWMRLFAGIPRVAFCSHAT